MAQHMISLALDSRTLSWLEEIAAETRRPIAEIAAEVLREEQARRALEALAAWVREDDAGPTEEEVDRARAMLLGDDDA